MELSLKRVLLQLMLIVLIISCFQALVVVFPPEAGVIYSPKLLLLLFLICIFILVHNVVFNYYLLQKKKVAAYIPAAFLLLVVNAGVYILLSSNRPYHIDHFKYWIEALGIASFFMLAGLALNALCIQLLAKNNYFENQIIIKQLELDHLKNQLNPHFLFNSLNNVAATIQVDQELALNYIYTLSSLLRYQIESSGKESVTLAEENFFIESFLGIEELRLGEQCEMSYEPEISNPGIKLPPMLLQPFVEHAIKTSCSFNSSSVVKITLREKDKELYLITMYSVPHDEASAHDKGNGIENARKRLTLFYLSSHKITTKTHNGFVETTLYIDLKSYKRIV